MNDMSRPDEQAPVLGFLADARVHGGAAVQRIDTHGAVVFLAGDRAFKLKRAVRYPFFDFSTLEKRRIACTAEVTLNRRTAPQVYEGLGAVVARPGGALALAAEGPQPGDRVVEWLVVMRRFDQEDLLDRIAARGDLSPRLMLDLADAVAAFHEEAEPVTDGGGAAEMRRLVAGVADRLRVYPDLFPGDRVRQYAALSEAALTRHGDLLDRRRDAGYVRHCHGDLHLRNIVMIDGAPVPFDCIEFDERLAVGDVLYDLAFLLMDLEHRKLRHQANILFNRYLEATGDIAGLALLPLFLSLRAGIRAHIAAAAVETQGTRTEADAQAAEARSYMDLALTLLQPPPARLIVVGGLSGTGKTTLARELAPEVGPSPGAVILRSDALRKRMLGVDESVRLTAESYSEAVTARVYGEMAGRAGLALDCRHAVICDGVYARAEQRRAIEAIARQAHMPFTGLWLVADQQTQLARVVDRVGDASDATADIVRRQAAYDIGEMTWEIIPANGPPGEVAAIARRLIAGSRGGN